ncbi:hypothetical protein FGIG_09202 [Fasciola gigantica]|uniref:Uncharacterized protein n=1 Tax=Fasciola gigantica TaxID=46835 RepID=A0A504YT00_FASGI|nr:hypothetical protein FGIG_09202 [Fasciola gigantica]
MSRSLFISGDLPRPHSSSRGLHPVQGAGSRCMEEFPLRHPRREAHQLSTVRRSVRSLDHVAHQDVPSGLHPQHQTEMSPSIHQDEALSGTTQCRRHTLPGRLWTAGIPVPHLAVLQHHSRLSMSQTRRCRQPAPEKA